MCLFQFWFPRCVILIDSEIRKIRVFKSKLSERKDFLHSSIGKESACNAGDPGSIPALERPSGEGNGNPFQYSHLENPMDRGAWQATVHGIARVGHDLATKPLPLIYDLSINLNPNNLPK